MESSDLAFEAGLWNEEEQNYFLLCLFYIVT